MHMRIPMHRLAVRVIPLEGAGLIGTIFLDQSRANQPLYLMVEDYLERENSFFPFKNETTGDTDFINKETIKMVEWVRLNKEEEGEQYANLMQAQETRVTFVNGSTLDGTLLSDVPPEKHRLSDCLNIDKKFLIIRTDTDYIHINKAKILKVEYLS